MGDLEPLAGLDPATFGAIVLMLAVSPAAGWRWIIEAVTNSEGTAGMRFVFTQ